MYKVFSYSICIPTNLLGVFIHLARAYVTDCFSTHTGSLDTSLSGGEGSLGSCR